MASVVRIGEQVPADPAPLPWRQQQWAEKLPESIERGAEHLISLQADEGYWVGELEADSTLESDYIYYLNVLGKADPVRIAKLANYVRSKQLGDGGWNIYPDGPSELNATCKAYFALKLAGDNANSPHLAKARAVRAGKADNRAADLAPTIQQLQTAGAHSLRAIAAGLNANGITAARGGSWSAAQVRSILARCKRLDRSD